MLDISSDLTCAERQKVVLTGMEELEILLLSDFSDSVLNKSVKEAS